VVPLVMSSWVELVTNICARIDLSFHEREVRIT